MGAVAGKLDQPQINNLYTSLFGGVDQGKEPGKGRQSGGGCYGGQGPPGAVESVKERRRSKNI